MYTFHVERSEGPAGFEKTIWETTCEALTPLAAIRESFHSSEEEAWPVTRARQDVAIVDDPEYVGNYGFEKCIIATKR